MREAIFDVGCFWYTAWVNAGAPEGDRSQGVNGYVLNTMTPETATTIGCAATTR